MLALVFSQAVAAAYACPLGGQATMDAIGSGHGAEAMPDCDGMPDDAVPRANLCETHCLTGQQVQPSDAPTPPLAALPPLVVRVRFELAANGDGICAQPAPPTAAPPPRLRFGRLLI
jgi:hypothetical protein